MQFFIFLVLDLHLYWVLLQLKNPLPFNLSFCITGWVCEFLGFCKIRRILSCWSWTCENFLKLCPACMLLFFFVYYLLKFCWKHCHGQKSYLWCWGLRWLFNAFLYSFSLNFPIMVADRCPQSWYVMSRVCWSSKQDFGKNGRYFYSCKLSLLSDPKWKWSSNCSNVVSYMWIFL